MSMHGGFVISGLAVMQGSKCSYVWSSDKCQCMEVCYKQFGNHARFEMQLHVEFQAEPKGSECIQMWYRGTGTHSTWVHNIHCSCVLLPVLDIVGTPPPSQSIHTCM